MSVSAKVCGDTSLQCAVQILWHCCVTQLAVADCASPLDQSQVRGDA